MSRLSEYLRTSPVAARIVRWVAVVTLGVVATALAWFRLDDITRDTLWAEDSRIFLTDALHSTSPLDLLEPYTGYLQVVPRLAALLVVWLAPISHYAVAMSLVMSVIAGAVTALVFVLTRDFGISRWARLGLALITVLAPYLVLEVLGNAANVHSVLLWLAPFVFLYRPRTWPGAVSLGVVALLVLTSEIQAVLFLPLLLWRPRYLRKLPIDIGAAIGLGLELWATISAPRPASLTPGLPSVASTVYGFVLHAVGGEWVSRPIVLGRVIADSGWLVAFALAVPVVASGVFLLVRSRRDRLVVVSFLLAAGIIWTVDIVVNFQTVFDYATYTAAQLRQVSEVRYAAVPSMLLLAVLVIAADRLVRSRPIVVRAVGAALGLAVVATFAVNFSTGGHTLREHGPAWSTQVAAATRTCATQDAATSVALTAAPDPAWQLVLTCGELTAGRG